MNIKEAKEYMKHSVQIYLKKNEFSEYRIPIVRQRPMFLLGSPGIGKTAVMEQIAEELGVALVSYSMTHHTRQSALGLPYISKKVYGDQEMSVSEYTMSEIISSVYETMEESGMKEGILFLDEINCVSETLAPAMLQFLQYKVFGRHQVPEGWVIVTAGNPPEFNKSVREFDVVTMDRLRVLEVEADYKIWREYAVEKGIHNVIINFLDLKQEFFYRIESTVKGRSYVTARGWEDLSEILTLYEEEELSVDETLVGQYLRNDKVVKEFTAYYDLYNKYKRDYQIQDILNGKASEFAIQKVKKASFDERLSLLSMLLDKVLSDCKEHMQKSDVLGELSGILKAIKGQGATEIKELLESLQKREDEKQKILHSLQKANSLSAIDRKKLLSIKTFLEEGQKELLLSECTNVEDGFNLIKDKFEKEVLTLKTRTGFIQQELHAIFDFVEKAFEEGNEMLILVTELTVNTFSSRFIARFGCDDYKKHNQELMISERQNTMQKEIELLDL
ncbi:MAG: AAA family ATPase [Lachnospiraceae bacterium]|nr:AAA family ATPase [Lachnospiraceae bacterium]